jgi:hypothetical protein
VLLTDGLTIVEYGAGDIEFASTVDSAVSGNYGLNVYSAGATIFNGAVGSDALDSLSQDTGLGYVYTNATGSTQINGGSVTTTNYQYYLDPVTLGADTILTSTYVRFFKTLDSDLGNNRTLLVNASGITRFMGEVGGIDALASLTTDIPGNTWIWNNVTTTGTQTYNDDVDLIGDVTAESTGDAEIKFAKTVDGGHNLIVNTGGDTKFIGNVGSDLPLTTLTTDAGGTTYVSGDVTTTSGIHFGDNVVADGNQRLDAGAGTLDADMSIVKTTAGNLNLAGDAGIVLGGNVLGTGGFGAGDTITFENDVTADGGSQILDAGLGTLDADGHITKTTAGDLTLGGDAGILVARDVTTIGNAWQWLVFSDAVTADGSTDQRFASGDGDLALGYLRAWQDIDKTGPGDLTIDGYGVWLYGDVDVSAGSLVIGSDYDAPTKDSGTERYKARGNLTAAEDVTLTANKHIFEGDDHQSVIAASGTVSVLENSQLVDDSVEKLNGGDLFISGGSDGLAVDIELPINVGGNLWITGNGDIQVSGDLSAVYSGEGESYGGVAIISENGSIYTEGTDGLNVSVTGYSDHVKQIGVYDLEVDEQTGRPTFYEGGEGEDLIPRAAIIIQSPENLTIGEDAELTALGIYDTTGAVDDRGFVDFLADPLTSIGGIIRDEGDPIDVAIYLASTGTDSDAGQGNVHLDAVTIDVEEGGTMVVDAYDTVTFGDFSETPVALTIPQDFLDSRSYYTLEAFLNSQGVSSIEELLAQSQYDTVQDFLMNNYEYFMELEEGKVWDVDRLEVVSRITEWLYQAVGRLPFAHDPTAIAAFEAFIGGDYILRGAGLDNLAITDGRAWVLEDPMLAAPLFEEAGQALEPLTLGLAGCPVLVAAVSVELGVPGDTIQVSLANSFALNTNIQPCESCARLLNAATILRDEDGSGMVALNQVFNTVAPAGAPFTPEMATSIATAFAGRVNDGTQYATAIEYIDAFVRYLAVLDTEMGSPVADGDSIAFVMGKYGTGITESENSNIAAFVATRLESSATFGE